MQTTGQKRAPPVPAHVKYRTRTHRTVQADEPKQRPTDQLASLQLGKTTSMMAPPLPPEGPKIIDFLNLEDNTTQVASSVDVNQPIFMPYPHCVKFVEYEAFGVYEQTLFFRNNDHVARRIRVLPPDSPFFEVIGPRSPTKMKELKQSKVAAGMEVCFIVKFRPREVREYKVDIVVCTEREKFVVPVQAIGLRAVLHLPDSVDFGICPVKSTATKNIIAQNVGTQTMLTMVRLH